MNESSSAVEIAMRIPGRWSSPQELLERMPPEFQLTPESLVLPEGTKIELGFMQADDRFADIFRTSCRRPPTDDEQAAVDGYTVNALLCGPGGSVEAARAMMQAAAAFIRAGAAGVFIDNCALAFGGQSWLELTDDGGPDALTFAFVSIVGGRTDVYTMGMHVLGLRDIVMKRTDADADEFGIIDVIRYMAASDTPIDDGHLLADLNGPRFQAVVEASPAAAPAGSPMHNPFGRFKLMNMQDVAERN